MEQHHLFGNRSSKTHYYNKRGTEYAQTNLWNNILGTDLSRILYNESVREEILSYIKINRHSPYLSITLHKRYPYYLFGISTFPNSAYHSIALRKFSITIV